MPKNLLKKFIQICHQNTAIVLHKQNEGKLNFNFIDMKYIITYCNEALKLDPKSEKAYYNRAVAHMRIDFWIEAEDDLKAIEDLHGKTL